MDSAEAEAVLRALGEQLRWVSLGRHAWAVFTLPDGFRGRYFIHEVLMTGLESAGQPVYHYDVEVTVPRDLRKNAPGFKTQAEARAACECHYLSQSQGDCAEKWE